MHEQGGGNVRDMEVHRKLDLALDRLDKIERLLRMLVAVDITNLKQESNMAKTLDELIAQSQATLAKVEETKGLEHSIILNQSAQAQMIRDLKSALDAAGQDPVKLSALGDVMDQLAARVDETKQEAADAIVANTPAEGGGGAPSGGTGGDTGGSTGGG